MRCGMIGLGKLGLPVAASMASRGLQVSGYDIRSEAMQWPEDPSYEDGFAEIIEQAKPYFHFRTLTEVVCESDVIFVAVETPHEPRFEGITPLPEERADFDYSSLKSAIDDLAKVCADLEMSKTVSVISTVLPGTMEREIEPLLGEYLTLVYNPSFIAMGTTVRDFLDPEFVLIGGDEHGMVERVYRDIYGHDRPRFARTSVKNAELIKVSYNTFIGLKIAFANTLMEVCHKTGCDVDEVTDALKLARRRLISPAYLSGGMGDGGGCHPRDNIALSWLAQELGLSYDLFEAAMLQRERQADWLSALMIDVRARGQDEVGRGLHLGILGTAYKPESRLQTGSPALLVKSFLERDGCEVRTWDPFLNSDEEIPRGEHVWLIGCRHPEFPGYEFAEGSVVIDPFRYIPDQDGVEVIRLGEGVDSLSHDRAA